MLNDSLTPEYGSDIKSLVFDGISLVELTQRIVDELPKDRLNEVDSMIYYLTENDLKEVTDSIEWTSESISKIVGLNDVELGTIKNDVLKIYVVRTPSITKSRGMLLPKSIPSFKYNPYSTHIQPNEDDETRIKPKVPPILGTVRFSEGGYDND